MSSGGAYAVQVASERSAAEAHASFRTLRAKFPNQLGGREPIVRRTDLGAKGIYYRAMVGPFASMEKAAGMCRTLKAAGCNCLVQASSNWPSSGYAPAKLERYNGSQIVVPVGRRAAKSYARPATSVGQFGERLERSVSGAGRHRVNALNFVKVQRPRSVPSAPAIVVPLSPTIRSPLR